MLNKAIKTPISDTVRVTRDGAIVVDTKKLFEKEGVKRLLQEIQSKTKIVVVDKPKTASR